MVQDLFNSIIHRSNEATQQLVNASINFFLNHEPISNTSLSILVFFEDLNDFNTTWSYHPMNRQGINRLVAGSNESFSYHGITSLSQLLLNFTVTSVSEGWVSTCSSCDLA
jgi:hypothetical protein